MSRNWPTLCFLLSFFVVSSWKIKPGSCFTATNFARTRFWSTRQLNHLKWWQRGFLSSSSFQLNSMTPRVFPELVVFDLDACFWDQEMYLMNALPTSTRQGDLNGRGQGVIAAVAGGVPIRLHKGSLQALQDHADGKFPQTKFAFASSADTPFAEQVGRAALKMLEVIPGLTVWDLVCGRDWNGRDVNQIGRQPPLSSNKARSHFPRLRELTGIRYDRMLFFDDCNWGDHCGMVRAACREPDTNLGPAIVRTPDGLGIKEWQEGLKVYAQQAADLGIMAE